jgi:cysteine desulfurase
LSHVLLAMGLSEDRIRGALRLSWCHLTPTADWGEVCQRLAALRG